MPGLFVARLTNSPYSYLTVFQKRKPKTRFFVNIVSYPNERFSFLPFRPMVMPLKRWTG
jgi:hypothetical protein